MASGRVARIPVLVAGREDIREQYAQFREQNVAVTNGGKVVLFCQARNRSAWSDRSGQDLVCRTSDDSGASWVIEGEAFVRGPTHAITPGTAGLPGPGARQHRTS